MFSYREETEIRILVDNRKKEIKNSIKAIKEIGQTEEKILIYEREPEEIILMLERQVEMLNSIVEKARKITEENYKYERQM